MTSPYVEPGLDRKAFNCPLCNAYANFWWSSVSVSVPNGQTSIRFKAAQCAHCSKWTLWTHEVRQGGHSGDLVYPAKLTSPMPHADLPDSCKSEYEEARNVLPSSPRASAALLRLCIQKLCGHLGGGGRNINDDIAGLVKGGLDQRIQRALDIVRVTGNNAVHPGTMDLSDDRELVGKLFKLVNMIVDEMIAKPKELNTLYDGLPEEAKQAIVKRDNNK